MVVLNINEETARKLAEISAISGIPAEELKSAYDALENKYDPSLAKCLTRLEQRAELNKALDSFYIAVGNALFTTRIIDWLERKLTEIERRWNNR